jgi:hypothetical protein
LNCDVLQERGLAYPRVAANNERATLTGAHRLQQAVEKLTLGNTIMQGGTHRH